MIKGFGPATVVPSTSDELPRPSSFPRLAQRGWENESAARVLDLALGLISQQYEPLEQQKRRLASALEQIAQAEVALDKPESA